MYSENIAYICIINDTDMKGWFDEYTVYEFSDEEIIGELCKRLKAARRGCCYSQQDLAGLSGVSIASIKRIETGSVKDLNVCTLIKLMRPMGMLEGFANLVPEVPESPFLEDGDGETKKKYCRKAYRRIEK